MKNESGFSLVYLMILLPLLMGAMITFSGVEVLIQKKTRSLHICRVDLLKMQKDVALTIKKILELNPEVIQLRGEKIKAQVSLATAMASGDYPAMQAAHQWMRIIESRQAALFQKQNILIRFGNSQYQKGTQEAEAHIRNTVQMVETNSRHLWAHNTVTTNTKIPQTPLNPDISDAEPRIYSLKTPLIQHSAAHVFWNTGMDSQQRIKEWTKFKTKNKDTCGASLTTSGTDLIPILNEDKSLLK